MDDFVFLDTSFDNKLTSEYHLSIQVSLDGFSFSVHQGDQKKCLALKHIELGQANSGTPENLLKERILHEEFLNSSYQSVSILWTTPKATLVPEEFFSEETASDLFQLCFPLEKREKILWKTIKGVQSTLIYTIPESLLNFLSSQFGEMELFHHTFPLLQFSPMVSEGNHPKIHVHVEKEFINIFIANKENKNYFNSFSYRDPADMVYYILNVIGQLKLNPEQSKVSLSGRINPESAATILLKKYLSQIEFKAVEGFDRINTGKKKSLPLFVNLLNLSKCE